MSRGGEAREFSLKQREDELSVVRD